MSYTPVRRIRRVLAPSADAAMYGLGAITLAEPTAWGARQVLVEFLNALRALPFDWGGYTLTPRTVSSPQLYQATPDDQADVSWPKANYTEAQAAWKTGSKYVYGAYPSDSIGTISISQLIQRVSSLVASLPLRAPSGFPTWAAGVGLALVAGAIIFAKWPGAGGKKTKTKRRRRGRRPVRRAARRGRGRRRR